jgi:hypothetical protein
MKTLRIILGILLCCTLYFIPWGIAIIRVRTNTVAIFCLNFFLGWTLIGWVIALIWAVASDDKKITAVRPS